MIEKCLRLATLEDIDWLVSCARKFHIASPYNVVGFSESKSHGIFESVIRGKLEDGVILVVLQDEAPIGFLAGMVSQPLFSSQRIAMELAWWVEPDQRGTRASLLVYRAYEDWARRVGCVAIQGAYLPGFSPGLDKFYERRGYRQVETSYMKEL